MGDESKKRRPWAWIGVALFALLVAYPLSAGPAIRLCDEINSNPCALPAQKYSIIYGPLWDIAERTGTTDTLVRSRDWFRDPRRWDF
jgi:hypothetical protein